MTVINHYFNQTSRDVSQYFLVRGMIDKHNLALMSARGLFSATAFDVGTRILLKYFKFHHSGDVSVLDLGCGYGLVSNYIVDCYAKKKYPDLSKLHIDACDSSALAVDVTTHNLKNHDTIKTLTYKVVGSDVLSDAYFLEKMYQVIITNPPFSAGKKVVCDFIQQAYNHLDRDGLLWIVVPTNKWAKSYIKITEEIFWANNIEIIALEAWYRVRTARK